MLAETSSSVDDVASETANEGMESYHGSIKVGEAVQRRETMELGEMTPIRAAILDGRVGGRRTTADDGEDVLAVATKASGDGDEVAGKSDGKKAAAASSGRARRGRGDCELERRQRIRRSGRDSSS